MHYLWPGFGSLSLTQHIQHIEPSTVQQTLLVALNESWIMADVMNYKNRKVRCLNLSNWTCLVLEYCVYNENAVHTRRQRTRRDFNYSICIDLFKQNWCRLVFISRIRMIQFCYFDVFIKLNH